MIKICDFGISKIIEADDQSMISGLGTLKFMAPEIIKEEKKYDEKVDVYSFGFLIYFMISGGKFPKIAIPDIASGKKAAIPSSFNDFAKNLIIICWNYNASDRPSFDTICLELEKNAFKLILLSKNELSEVNELVNQYKVKISKI